MSHINEALKKAQREKDSIYHRYKKLIAGPDMPKDGGRGPRRKKYLLGLLGLLLVVAAYALSSYIKWQPEETATAPPQVVNHSITEQQTTTAKRQSRIIRGPRISTSAARKITPTAEKPQKKTTAQTVTQATPPKEPAPSVAQSPAPKSFESLPAAAVPEKTSLSPVHREVTNTGTTPSPPSVKKELQTAKTTIVKPTVPPTSAMVENLYRQALMYHRDNNLLQAEKLYRTILRRDQNFATALNNLGVIYMTQQKDKQAIHAFSKATKIKYDYVDPYYNLACLYSRSGDIPLSAHFLKKAIELKNDVKIWANNDRDLSRLRQSKEYAVLIGETPTVKDDKYEIYIVKKNEWLFDIIRNHYGVSNENITKIIEVLQRLNPELKNSFVIYPGQKLMIPTKESVEGLLPQG